MMMNSEQKTTDNVESKPTLVDNADIPQHGVPEPDGDATLLVDADGSVKARADWLFCIKRRGSVIKKLAFMMIGIPVIALLYFIVSSALSAVDHLQVVKIDRLLSHSMLFANLSGLII